VVAVRRRLDLRDQDRGRGSRFKAGAYIAAGLVLFLLTFLVDTLARGATSSRLGAGNRRGGR
jgi:hypothetical protein